MKGPVRVELANGAVLLLHEDRTNPSIAFRGSVRAGSAYEEARGAAEFAARLFFRGTKWRTASKIADATEGLGAALSAFNAHEAVAILGRCTRETLRETLAILTESLAHPALAQGELVKVRGEILGDIRAQQDDTRRVATQRLLGLVYPRRHPYARDPKGDERSLTKVGRRDVRAFHEARYGASGMVFGFSGDLDEETFRSTVAAAFERLDGGEVPNSVRPPRSGKRANATISMPRKSQADFVVGRVAIPRNHPNYYALNLANVLFGRIGLFGRLGQRLSDDLGLAYYSFSTLETRLAGGHWYVSAGVNPKNLEKAMVATREEMERLEGEPFTEREIHEGKENLVGGLQVNLERNPEYATALHDIEYFGLGIDFLKQYPSIVRSLKPDVVRDKAVEYFDPSKCSWVASGSIKGTKLAF